MHTKALYKQNTIMLNIILSFISAIFIAMMAQVRIVLPWTPVPIVGSTVGVLLIAGFMNRLRAIISILLYIALGIIGLPVFSGMKGGINTILGPTGGYIIGFIFATIFISYIKGYLSKNIIIGAIFLFMAHMIIYAFGILQLYFYMNNKSLIYLLFIGVIPFIIGDIIKSFITSIVFHIAK